MRGSEHRESGAGRRDRGNVLLATALVLAALVVLVAASMMLAPTSSDGVVSDSVDQRDIAVVEEGLGVVFVESNDTLNPAYEPTFEPPESEGPPPLDYGTVAELLGSEPFTTEQVVQTQSLMASLAHRSMGGTVASLEPVASETRTGTLVRLGNIEAHDFGGNETVLVENATAVRDVELVFERETLPFTPENATTVEVGDWALATYQDVSSGRVNYQLGEYDPAGEWRRTDQGEDLRVTVHENTVNGEPVDDGPAAASLAVDPGEPPFDVVVRDTRWEGTPPEFPDTHGGVNLVAVGAGPDNVSDRLEEGRDWQEVVTHPAFNVTYLDSTTTFVDRVSLDARYTYFEYRDSDAERDPRVGIDTDVATVEFGPQEGVLINDSDGAQLTKEVLYWNGSTADVTGETAYEIPPDYQDSAAVQTQGGNPHFVPELYLEDDDHEVQAAYEITSGGETYTFDEQVPVNVVNPITDITVEMETAELDGTEGLMPILQDSYEVTVTGEFIDGKERSLVDHGDVALELDGEAYVTMAVGESVTLAPAAPTPEGEAVELSAAFLPTDSYEEGLAPPLEEGADAAPVVDPVEDIGIQVESESEPLPIAELDENDPYLLVERSYNVTTVASLLGDTEWTEVTTSAWVDHDLQTPSGTAHLSQSATGLSLTATEHTLPGMPLTVGATYEFGETHTDEADVHALELDPLSLEVNIQPPHGEPLTLSGTANVSAGAAYQAVGWPDFVYEVPPGAITSCQSNAMLAHDCVDRPYTVTALEHGTGTLTLTVDEGELLQVTGETLTGSDSVETGLAGTGLQPPHRAYLVTYEAVEEGSLHQGTTVELDINTSDLLDPGNLDWLEEGVTERSVELEVPADRPTELSTQENIDAADAYEAGDRLAPPFLVGDFVGPNSSSHNVALNVNFQNGEFEPTDPFHGGGGQSEGVEAFIPRSEGTFEPAITVTRLDNMSFVPVLGSLSYNVTINEEVLYGRGEANLLDPEVITTNNLFTVSTDLENKGNRTGLFDVAFEVLDTTLPVKEDGGYQLGPGEIVSDVADLNRPSASFDLSLDPGEYTAEMSTRDGNVSLVEDFEIEGSGEPEPSLSQLDIAGQGDDAIIVEGDDENISVKVENVGDVAGSFEVEVEIGGETIIQETDVIGIGDNKTITFEDVTGSLSSSTYDVNVGIVDKGFELLTGALTVEQDGPPCSGDGCPE